MEIRTDCKVCGGDLPNSRYRVFCSAKCRNKWNNDKYTPRNAELQRLRADKKASVPSKDKVQCLICGLWYVQLGSHVQARHDMTAREYREEYGLDVKRGTVPKWYRKQRGDQTLENETYKNLKKGAKYRFTKGQEGVGVYKRSPQTIDRLKNKHKH